jgi:hypothetical protein
VLSFSRVGFSDVVPLAGESTVIIASAYAIRRSGTELLLAAIDARGRNLWTRSIEASGGYLPSATAVGDGFAVLYGNRSLARSDSSGTLLRARSFNEVPGTYTSLSISAGPSVLYLFGRSQEGASMGDVRFKPLLLEVDVWGAITRQRYIEVGNAREVKRAVPAPDGGLVLLLYPSILVRLDRDWNILWSRSYGGARIWMSRDIATARDGDILLASQADEHFIVVRMNPEGSLRIRGPERAMLSLDERVAFGIPPGKPSVWLPPFFMSSEYPHISFRVVSEPTQIQADESQVDFEEFPVQSEPEPVDIRFACYDGQGLL